ncbi:4Fe-4S single cluster domain-containing protein [Caloramator quimbayensis]|uniref:4Fe-4S single cluster domain-containing protein n=1 Tax=Caloramator quimbayensis TaxID=1147123 RepID=A0A1T4XLH0_9CLOT|nr:radical SAM protein [Caloramator quimbayensis]SKA90233.1 4Fe-4S single cluster domain-containing protein [Caloramator quimbayensis]
MNGMRFIVTYNCNFSCSSCRYKCGPYKKGVMDSNIFRNKALKLYEEGYKDYLIIEGGEPFLHIGTIYKYLKKIKNIDSKKYIITNGFWGKMDTYLYSLSDLKEMGLYGIIIEYDYFHSAFIDILTIKSAIEKALLNGLNISVRAAFLTRDISVKADIITFEYIKEIRKNYKNIGYIFEDANFKKQSLLIKPKSAIREKVIFYNDFKASKKSDAAICKLDS